LLVKKFFFLLLNAAFAMAILDLISHGLKYPTKYVASDITLYVLRQRSEKMYGAKRRRGGRYKMRTSYGRIYS
jgi:hypothetical protein